MRASWAGAGKGARIATEKARSLQGWAIMLRCLRNRAARTASRVGCGPHGQRPVRDAAPSTPSRWTRATLAVTVRNPEEPMTRRSALALTLLALAACTRDPSIVHREAGDDLLRGGDFAGAAKEFTESLKVDPRQPGVWEKLAFCRVKTGEKEAAAEGLVKLADFKPSDAQKAEVYRNAAGIFLQGQTAE